MKATLCVHAPSEVQRRTAGTQPMFGYVVLIFPEFKLIQNFQYQMLEDKFARQKKRKPEFELTTYYGQLTHIYRVHFPQSCKAMETTEPTTYIFAAIRNCVLSPDDPLLGGLDIHFYSRHGALDVIDITSVQCLVGRVKDLSDEWAIIDRSGSLARAEWQGEDEDDE